MWLAIAGVATIDILWVALGRPALSPTSIVSIAGVTVAVAIGAVASRKLAEGSSIHTLVTGATMLLAAWPSLRIFNHLTMSVGLPLADPWLAQMDRLIGFDWIAYIRFMDGYPTLVAAMGLSYGSLTDYSILLFLVLVVGQNPAPRCAEFVKLFLLTALACMTIGMCFPAVAAAAFYTPPAEAFGFIRADAGSYHLTALHSLRTDQHPVLDFQHLPGLVTFPSFHTAMGVIAIYCARHDPVLLSLSILVNVTMIASTPIFGSHYAIDILAGALVAGIAILFVRGEARRTVRLTQTGEPLVPHQADALAG